MEVHQHTHTARKKWHHYFWEFFMLFLAVSLGFIVENQREHYIEHQREKQYIQSMVEDLRSDTAQIGGIINTEYRYIALTDTFLIELLNENSKTNSAGVYQLWERAWGFPDFFQNDRTIQQLKNSGALRLIRNKQVSDSIMGYDNLVRRFSVIQQSINDFIVKTIDLKYRLFAIASLKNKKDKPIPLLSANTNFLEEIYGFKLDYKNFLFVLISYNTRLRQRAINLITLITKEYHL